MENFPVTPNEIKSTGVSISVSPLPNASVPVQRNGRSWCFSEIRPSDTFYKCWLLGLFTITGGIMTAICSNGDHKLVYIGSGISFIGASICVYLLIADKVSKYCKCFQ